MVIVAAELQSLAMWPPRTLYVLLCKTRCSSWASFSHVACPTWATFSLRSKRGIAEMGLRCPDTNGYESMSTD